MRETVSLIYFSDSEPGIRRKRWGRGFAYFDPRGKRIDCEDTRERITGLAVPPAYRDVWICPDPRGHLQATGRDEKGRKQYRYHPLWTKRQQERKFDDLLRLAPNLPSLRRWISTRLSGDPGAEETTIATALALIDRASLRVGDPAYTQANGSFGVTTLTGAHMTADDGQITLDYMAKGKRKVRKQLTGKRLATVLEACQDLPGTELLSWIGADGSPRRLTADQINAVLSDLCGEGITAKALRTWNGTLAAFSALIDGADTINALAKAAAEALHNTPAIARKSYIHPAVLEAVGSAEEVNLIGDTPDGLRRHEDDLHHFLKRAGPT